MDNNDKSKQDVNFKLVNDEEKKKTNSVKELSKQLACPIFISKCVNKFIDKFSK